MRIALLTCQWPGARMGGIGTTIRHAAAALASAGCDVHLFTFTLPEEIRAEAPAGVVMHEVRDLAERVVHGDTDAALAQAVQGGGDGVYRLALGRLLCEAMLQVHRDRPFDLIEVPEVEALGLSLAMDFDAPLVTQLYCCTEIARQANERPATPDETALVELEFAAIHLSDAVYAPTQAVVRATRAVMPELGDVRVIPCAFECDAKPFEPPPADGPILFVGRLERLKGVERIADALREFLPRNPEARFRFIGPDTNTAAGESMRQWIESRLPEDLRDRVDFTGELPISEVRSAWRSASFGVMPSLRENFSMACCEAMAAGRALIVGAGTGSVELAGNAALVANPGAASEPARQMESLWRDRREIIRLGRIAHERIRERFAPSVIAAARVEFYRETVERFATMGVAARREKLRTLSPRCAAAILPALLRMTERLCGITEPASLTPGTRLLRIMDDIQSRDGRPAQVLLYGAGRHTSRLLSERAIWERREHRVVGIIDDHPRFDRDPVHLDLPVQSVAQARAGALAGDRLPPIVLSTDTYEDQFWRQCAPLREAGVAVHRLYSPAA